MNVTMQHNGSVWKANIRFQIEALATQPSSREIRKRSLAGATPPAPSICIVIELTITNCQICIGSQCNAKTNSSAKIKYGNKKNCHHTLVPTLHSWHPPSFLNKVKKKEEKYPK